MSLNPRICRIQAQACMDLARTATDPHIKANYAQMAALWLGLANEANWLRSLQETLDDMTPVPSRAEEEEEDAELRGDGRDKVG